MISLTESNKFLSVVSVIVYRLILSHMSMRLNTYGNILCHIKLVEIFPRIVFCCLMSIQSDITFEKKLSDYATNTINIATYRT